MQNHGKVKRISGALVIAEDLPAIMYDTVHVGWNKVLGEVIKLYLPEVIIQCFDSTTELAIGDPVVNTGRPLAVELGPGLLGTAFDALQRPFARIAQVSKGPYLPPTCSVPALDPDKLWHFRPGVALRPGQILRGGDVYGSVVEAGLAKPHLLMVPPQAKGRLLSLAEEGDYSVHEALLELDSSGRSETHPMAQRWPVRQSRGFQERLRCVKPVLTGQRVLDGLLPIAMGGRCRIIGPPGSGKSVLLQQILDGCDVQCVIHVGCGLRGNETADFIRRLNNPSFPTLNRVSLVASMANIRPLGKWPGVPYGAAIAEYYRDMGYDVALLIDSLSPWIEAHQVVSDVIDPFSSC